ncbi:MAG: FeoA family protein [Dissulfurimicrobium sp.]|uniref:FeoA family protein n=1 Tax=Dissulfurimicrobium sp. TaxID=2022436 RepID=UPI00404A1F1B
MPLAMVENGRRVRLVSVEGGYNFKRRLSVLGLVPGVEVEMIRNPLRGPVIIGLKESRLVLGRGMAQKVIVR